MASKGLLEVAPVASYVSTWVNQDDLVIRTTSSNARVHLTTGSNTGIVVAGSNVGINAAPVSTYALSVAGNTNATDVYANGISLSTLALAASNIAAWASNSIPPAAAPGTGLSDFDHYHVLTTALENKRLYGISNIVNRDFLVAGGLYAVMAHDQSTWDATTSNGYPVTSFLWQNNTFPKQMVAASNAILADGSNTSAAQSATTVFSLPLTFIGSNAQLSNAAVVVGITGTQGYTTGQCRGLVARQRVENSQSNFQVVYFGPSNNHNIWNDSYVAMPMTYTVPSDGSNYYAGIQMLGNSYSSWSQTTGLSSNYAFDTSTGGPAPTAMNTASNYAFAKTNYAFEYKWLIGSNNGNTMTTLTSKSNVALLSNNASNLYVMAMINGGATSANVSFEGTANAGSNWTVAAPSNLSTFNTYLGSSAGAVMAARMAVTPGTRPNYRIRLLNTSLAIHGIALRWL